MTKELSAIDIHYLLRELKALEKSKVDRIYHSKENPNNMVLALHITGSGKTFLNIMLPSIIFMDSQKQDQGTATGLCMMLRKYLEGGILVSVSQRDFERIIELRFKVRDQRYHLIIELFSKGNIIFCDQKYNILNLLNSQRWKDRTIERGKNYESPKSINLRLMTKDEFTDKLLSSNKNSLVKALAIDFSMGGKYSEELCAISGMGKDKALKDITKYEAVTIFKNFQDIINKEINAHAYDDTACPFVFKTLKGNIKNYESFSQAILDNIAIVDKISEKLEVERKKILSIIEEQEKNLSEAEAEHISNKSKAEAIYSKYQDIENIIKAIREARKKYSWREIEKRINSDNKLKSIILSIDEKNHSITMRINDDSIQ